MSVVRVVTRGENSEKGHSIDVVLLFVMHPLLKPTQFKYNNSSRRYCRNLESKVLWPGRVVSVKRKPMILIITGIVLAWAFSVIIITLFVDREFRGVAGDMFGAVNSLFSGFAFAGIIYTIGVQRQELQEQQKAILMQTEELTLQRKAIEMQNEELRMQREEAARSADQLESQRKLMNLQIVMTTVNDLIKSKNKRLEYIKLKINGTEERGVRAITALVRRNINMNRPIV